MAQLDPPLQMWPIDAANPQSVIGADWLRWFQRVYSLINASPSQIGSPATVTNQTGAINSQTLHLANLANGPASVSWYLEKTATDGTGSSLQVQVDWTRAGQSLSRGSVPLSADVVGANASATWPIVIDQNSAITYSIGYTSNSGAMQYFFSIWVHQP